MRTSIVFLAGVGLGGIGFASGCSRASSSSGPAPAEERLLGEYTASGSGLIEEVTFEDETHYSMVRTDCTGGAKSCSEVGTYVVEGDFTNVSFTDEATGATTELSFHTLHAAEASTLESFGLHVLGGGLTSDSGTSLGGGGTLNADSGATLVADSGTTLVSDGGTTLASDGSVSVTGEAGVKLGTGVGVCLAGSNTALTISGTTQLVFSFTLGTQTFSGGVTAGTGDGGTTCSGSGSGSG